MSVLLNISRSLGRFGFSGAMPEAEEKGGGETETEEEGVVVRVEAGKVGTVVGAETREEDEGVTGAEEEDAIVGVEAGKVGVVLVREALLASSASFCSLVYNIVLLTELLFPGAFH